MKKCLPNNCSPEHAAYLLAIDRKERLITIARYLILVGFIVLWEVFARTGVIDPFIGRYACAALLKRRTV